MTDRIEQVKAILENFRKLDEIDSASYQAGINADRNIDEAAKKIVDLDNQPVKTEEDSISIDMKSMEIGGFCPIKLDNKDYFRKRIGDTTIEMYAVEEPQSVEGIESCLLTDEEIIGDFCKACDYSLEGCIEHGQQSTCASYKEALRQKKTVAKAQLAKAQPIIDAAVRLECQKVIAANNEEYFGRHKAELEQARTDEREKVLKEVDILLLDGNVVPGINLSDWRIIPKVKWDKLQGKEVKP